MTFTFYMTSPLHSPGGRCLHRTSSRGLLPHKQTAQMQILASNNVIFILSIIGSYTDLARWQHLKWIIIGMCLHGVLLPQIFPPCFQIRPNFSSISVHKAITSVVNQYTWKAIDWGILFWNRGKQLTISEVILSLQFYHLVLSLSKLLIFCIITP